MDTAKNHQPPPTHEEIAARARQLWSIAGSPERRDLEFWLAAEAEVGHERGETGRAADTANPDATAAALSPSEAPHAESRSHRRRKS
jgi:hypothetical protein